MGYKINNQTIITDAGGITYNNATVTADDSITFFTGSQVQGTTTGYASGGTAFAFGESSTIYKFAFVSDSDATDIANLTIGRGYASGQSSEVSGYTSGGRSESIPQLGIPASYYTRIDKFPFAADLDATNVGNLNSTTYSLAGHSSDTDGYTSGGRTGFTTYFSTIAKFPFAADTPVTDVANLSIARGSAAGQSSTTHGYTSGGSAPPNIYSIIEKFPFAADTPVSTVGNLVGSYSSDLGNSSFEAGYASSSTNGIERFPFATDANSSSVGSLASPRVSAAGTQSGTAGYLSNAGTTEKFPFAAENASANVSSIPNNSGVFGMSGNQI